MSSFGKKILAAFVEVTDDSKPDRIVTEPQTSATQQENNFKPLSANAGKFKQYFEKLFRDANIPGPDYFEFSKMAEAMKAIPDEKTRYLAAFAGLQVQGLDRQKLLSTAHEYLKVLDTDAANFNTTVEAAVQEKVHAKKTEAEQMTKRIAGLSEEIAELQSKVTAINNEVTENLARLESSTGGYKTEMAQMRNSIAEDIEKIKRYIA